VAEFPSWIDDADAWDRVGLADFYLPGICTVSGLEIARDIDVKKTKGSDGATMTDNGIDPAAFSITMHMTAEEWPMWLAVLPKVHPRRPGGAREPMAIRHPEPNALGITNIYVKTIKVSPPSPRGGYTVTLGVIEWFPAPKPVKKAAGKGTPPAKPRPGSEKYFGDPKALARDQQQNAGFPVSPEPDEFNNIAQNLFP